MNDWTRSSHCDWGNCLEARLDGDTVQVRNSKDPDTVLTFTLDEWLPFLLGVSAGEFDPVDAP